VARKEALPTAMRLELSRPSHDRLSLRITKDRRGRLSGPIAVDVADLIGSGGTAAGARQDRDGSELAPPALHALP